MDLIDQTLQKLARLIADGAHESLETDTLEIKPVPADGSQWREIHKTVNAFLNTRGGVVLLGFKERSLGAQKSWEFTGYHDHAEPKIKELSTLFTSHDGRKVGVSDYCPDARILPFSSGYVAAILVDELPADRKFVFLNGTAYKRVLTGDHKITDSEIGEQQEYLSDLWNARELEIIPGIATDAIDLDALNEYIQTLNRPIKVETIKPDLGAARDFLHCKGFIRDGKITILGMLVAGRNPGDYLGLRAHVHCYVDAPQEIARDKQDLIGNILPLMNGAIGYLLRNIHVGVSPRDGGTATPQYPEEVLRESVNNALAHRDYSIDKQAFIAVKPGEMVSIQNPGCFRSHLLIDHPYDEIPIRRIIPEAKARNPKLADVLRVYRKWEGRGIGMATLVNRCLENRIDIPRYRIHSEEVRLDIRSGTLLGDRMKAHFESFDAYLREKLKTPPSREQLLVLAYLIKSHWENERGYHTILLTPDNNHSSELVNLTRAGLIFLHPKSDERHPIYCVDHVLMRAEYSHELKKVLGTDWDTLDILSIKCLNLIWRHNHFSTTRNVTPRMAAFQLWFEEKGEKQDIKEFDAFHQRVQQTFENLTVAEILKKTDGGVVINKQYRQGRLP